MDKIYKRINWENLPSEKTPIDETNLNKMDKAIDDLDNRIVEDLATKEELADKQDALLFDEQPTEDSEKLVTSGGIYTALQNVGAGSEGGGGQLLLSNVPENDMSVIDLSSLALNYFPANGDSGTLIVRINGDTVHKQIIESGTTELDIESIHSPGKQETDIIVYDENGCVNFYNYNVFLLGPQLDIYKDGQFNAGKEFIRYSVGQYSTDPNITRYQNNPEEKYYDFAFDQITPYGNGTMLKIGPFDLSHSAFKYVRAKYSAQIACERACGFGLYCLEPIFYGDTSSKRPNMATDRYIWDDYHYMGPNDPNTIYGKMIERDLEVDLSKFDINKKKSVWFAFWLYQGNMAVTNVKPSMKIFGLTAGE